MENESITCACGAVVERAPGDDLLTAVERHIEVEHGETTVAPPEEAP